METKTNIQQNKFMHLEESMIIYGIYSAETLEKLIKQCIACITLKHYMNHYLLDDLHLHTIGILIHTVIWMYNIIL